MSFYRISHALLFISIVSMLLGPVSEAKARAGLTNQIGLKNTATLQNKGLSGLKDFNAQSLLTQSSSKKSSSKQVSIQKSDEELLSKLSQDIYWKLKDWQDSKNNTLLAQDEKQELSNWISQLDSLQTKVNKNMNKLTQWIKDKKLPAIIMQRQQDAISKINSEIDGLKDHLNQLNQATTLSSSKQQLKGSFDFFKGKQLKRKHQVFDGLSSVALTPDRVPVATKTTDFSKYNFTSKSNSPQNTAAFNDPAYLGTSDEVVINQYIQDKATELENDPVKIYHWVRNNIEWLPSYGAIQASDITLGSGRGNAFDQSSLLIALLRAANVPARYAYGTIEVDIDKFTNWVGLTNPEAALTFVQYGAIPISPVIEGGVITKIRMEHIWVEAAIDFNPSRGAKNITPDSWVSLDASFKQYEVLTGLDPIAISGVDMNQVAQDFINSGTTNEAEGWVQGFDPTILTNTQVQMQTSLEQHITDNLPNPTVGDVIGGRRTIIKDYPTLPASMQLKVLLKANDFAEMQDIMRPKYRLAFDKDILGNIVNPLELNFAKLNNHKLTLSFKPATATDEQALAALIPENAQSIEDLPTSIPAHLIQVIPQVALDEVVVKSGSPMFLGYDLTLYYQVQFSIGGTMNKEYRIPAGSTVNLFLGAGSFSSKHLSDLKSKLASTKSIIETGTSSQINLLDGKTIYSDLFFLGMISWITEYVFVNHLMSKSRKYKFNLSPVFGSYGYEPNVGYLFGTPVNLNTGGLSTNLYTTRQIANDSEGGNLKDISFMIGILTSGLESSIPEQLYQNSSSNVMAASSLRILQKAQENNQKIFSITQNNISQISKLNLHPETKAEIQEAVLSGYTVITHTNNITVSNWTGVGYIILNPYTGDASFKISGGGNGAAMWLTGFFLIMLTIISLTNPGIFGGASGILLGINSGLILYSFLEDIQKVRTEEDAINVLTSTWISISLMIAAFIIPTPWVKDISFSLMSIVFEIFSISISSATRKNQKKFKQIVI